MGKETRHSLEFSSMSCLKRDIQSIFPLIPRIYRCEMMVSSPSPPRTITHSDVNIKVTQQAKTNYLCHVKLVNTPCNRRRTWASRRSTVDCIYIILLSVVFTLVIIYILGIGVPYLEFSLLANSNILLSVKTKVEINVCLSA